MLKRSVPNLSIENLRKLQSACGEEIYQNRSFNLQLGSRQSLSPTLNIEDESLSLCKIVVAHLAKYNYFQRQWGQYNNPNAGWPNAGWGYVQATPETEIRFYTRNRRYCKDYIKPLPELEISGDDPPKPRYAYLVWAVM